MADFVLSSSNFGTKQDRDRVVTATECKHGLLDGQLVKISEVNGIPEVNNKTYSIKVVSPTKFSIGAVAGTGHYQGGGICVPLPTPLNVYYKSYKENLAHPSFAEVSAEALYCAEDLHEEFSDADVVYNPVVSALAAGCAVTEVNKVLYSTGIPINQWLYLPAVEASSNNLSEAKICLVGLGPAGVNIARLLARMKACTGTNGMLTLVDHGNCHPHSPMRHPGYATVTEEIPKTEAIARYLISICPEMHVTSRPSEALQVCSESFLSTQNAAISAVSNVELRTALDEQCVLGMCGFTDVGMSGFRGHSQCFVPGLSERYSSMFDPTIEESFPMCVLKSFPSLPAHSSAWALNKTTRLFNSKPISAQQLMKNSKGQNLFDITSNTALLPDITTTLKAFKLKPNNFEDCVCLGRTKFEKYFYYRAVNVLQAFPENEVNSDGSAFWSLPRRCPQPVAFDPSDNLHLNFVSLFAIAWAKMWNIAVPDLKSDDTKSRVKLVAANASIPASVSVSKHKKISTSDNDESNSFVDSPLLTPEDVQDFGRIVETEESPRPLSLSGADGIVLSELSATAAQLRSKMFRVPSVELSKTHQLSSGIACCPFSTALTVSAVSAANSTKLIQKNKNLDEYQNLFFDSSAPFYVFAEPSACEVSKITETISFSLWDSWTVNASELHEKTVKCLVDTLEKKVSGLELGSIFKGSAMVYLPLMPNHKPRLQWSLDQAFKRKDEEYMDLMVSFEDDMGEDVSVPTIRLYF